MTIGNIQRETLARPGKLDAGTIAQGVHAARISQFSFTNGGKMLGPASRTHVCRVMRTMQRIIPRIRVVLIKSNVMLKQTPRENRKMRYPSARKRF